jgi:hypothetical protein
MGELSMRQRIAAVGGVGIVAVLAILLLWLGTSATPLSAMEKMAENVRKAKSCKSTIINIYQRHETTGAPAPGLTRTTKSTTYYLADGSRRTEIEDLITEGSRPEEDGVTKKFTHIYPAGKPGIQLNHQTKTYRRFSPEKRDALFIDEVQSLGNFTGRADRELGIKEINGKKARGFQFDDATKLIHDGPPDEIVDIWIDVESNLPIRVQGEGKKKDYFLSLDMQWNLDLEANLFDTTPPEGYADVTPKPPALEEQVRQITEALRIYAEASGGFYPRQDIHGVGTTENLCKMLGLVKFPAGEMEGNAGKAEKARIGFNQVSRLEHDNSGLAYSGKIVGPKDKDKVLLRWKLDNSRYEVIFGDLRAETVTTEKLHSLEGK